MDLIDKIKKLSENFNTDVIEIRRYLHQYPEISFKEFNTSKFIASKLDEFNIRYQKGFVKTGIVAKIEGKNPSKKIIALRAEMDALPIEEVNDLQYKSQNKGKMHACGHDVHISSLLGTAKILKSLVPEFEGTVKLLFQPGEEKLPGGAKQMIQEGVLKDPEPEIIIAQHVLPTLNIGTVGFKSGLYMASCDEIYISVKGDGGHAAIPDQMTDTVLIASNIIVALQQIVSRHANTSVPTVLSFGKVLANGSTNVIPDIVSIEGTFRTMNEKWRKEAHKKMAKVAKSIAKSMGGQCEINIVKGYPVLINDKKVTRLAKKFAEEYLGKENVIDLDIRMTAEDFAYFAQARPSTLFRLGTGNNVKNINSPLHSSTFNIDEDALKIGMGIMAWLAISFLK